MLTKSLHTVTAATNVARLLLIEKSRYYTGHRDGACKLAADALHVLGYDALVTVPYEFPGADPTVSRIILACLKLLEARILREIA